MKKRKSILVVGAVASAIAVLGLLAFNAYSGHIAIPTRATDKEFAFDSSIASQFGSAEVAVETGISNPIQTTFQYEQCSLVFGEDGKFMQCIQDDSVDFYYFEIRLGLNNITHFEMDLGAVFGGKGAVYYSVQFIARDGLECLDDLFGELKTPEHLEWTSDKVSKEAHSTIIRVEAYQATSSVYIDSFTFGWSC